MRTRTFVTALFAAALLAGPVAGMAQGQRNAGDGKSAPRAQVERGQRDLGADRLRDRDRLIVEDQDRDRIQDRTHVPDAAGLQQNNIYGYNLMSEEERSAYRDRIRNAESQAEKEQIMAEHRHEMQIRARDAGVELPEPKMAQEGKDN